VALKKIKWISHRCENGNEVEGRIGGKGLDAIWRKKTLICVMKKL
jgi:translation initiation factor IF-1